MTKSQMFKQAHKIAKDTVEFVGDYRIAFSFALKSLYAQQIESKNMKVSIDTDCYNERRFGKPWIAKMDFSQNARGDFSFGDWISDGAGEPGTLVLSNVNKGDVICFGHKDNRKGRSNMKFFIIDSDNDIKTDETWFKDLKEVTRADAAKYSNAA